MKYKDLQYNSISGWRNMSDCQYHNPDMEIRIKPEPTLRPWKPEEVPVGAWMRNKTTLNIYLLTGVMRVGYFFMTGSDRYEWSAFDSYEHSLDYGKTWQPCGVYET